MSSMRESWRSYPRLTLTYDKLYNVLSLIVFLGCMYVFPFKVTGFYNVTYHSTITDTLLSSVWVKIIILSNCKFHLLPQVIKKFVMFFGTQDFTALFTRTPYWGRLVSFTTPFQNITVLIWLLYRTYIRSFSQGIPHKTYQSTANIKTPTILIHVNNCRTRFDYIQFIYCC